MATILVIVGLTIAFVVGMTIFTDNQDYKNAVRYAELSSYNNNSNNIQLSDGTMIKISFSGAVNKKNTITIEAGTIMGEAISLAGGLLSTADLQALNFSYAIYEANSFYVPKVGTKDKISLNTATADELDDLDGIGEVTANKIISYRTENGEFYYLEQIKKITGIGPSLFDKIKDSIIL